MAWSLLYQPGAGGSSSSPAWVPRKGVGAPSGSTRGGGGAPSRLPGTVCRRGGPRSLLVRCGWEGCGYDGKGLRTLGWVPPPQDPSAWGLTTAGMGSWCGWDGGFWGAHVTLGPWPLLTFHLHLVSAVFVATQPTVWRGRSVVSGQRPSPCPPFSQPAGPGSRPTPNAPLTLTAVALLGDTPELGRESRRSHLG